MVSKYGSANSVIFACLLAGATVSVSHAASTSSQTLGNVIPAPKTTKLPPPLPPAHTIKPEITAPPKQPVTTQAPTKSLPTPKVNHFGLSGAGQKTMNPSSNAGNSFGGGGNSPTGISGGGLRKSQGAKEGTNSPKADANVDATKPGVKVSTTNTKLKPIDTGTPSQNLQTPVPKVKKAPAPVETISTGKDVNGVSKELDGLAKTIEKSGSPKAKREIGAEIRDVREKTQTQKTLKEKADTNQTVNEKNVQQLRAERKRQKENQSRLDRKNLDENGRLLKKSRLKAKLLNDRLVRSADEKKFKQKLKKLEQEKLDKSKTKIRSTVKLDEGQIPKPRDGIERAAWHETLSNPQSGKNLTRTDSVSSAPRPLNDDPNWHWKDGWQKKSAEFRHVSNGVDSYVEIHYQYNKRTKLVSDMKIAVRDDIKINKSVLKRSNNDESDS